MSVGTPFFACFFATLLASGAAAVPVPSLTRNLHFPAPEIRLTANGFTSVSLPPCEPDVKTACPVLPVAGVSFEIPAGYAVSAVTVTAEELREYPLTAPVQWGLPPVQPGEQWPSIPPDPAIYQGAAPYPDYTHPAWRTDPLRQGSLLSVQVHPVRFDPSRHLLLAALSVTVSVELREAPAVEKAAAQRAAFDATPSPLLPGGPHTYVVISTSNLIYNASAPWNFQALCEARARAGFTPAMVTTDWIYANYSGANPAAKIRAFVQDAYRNWGLRYLLVGGSFDLIPVQKLYVSFVDLVVTRTTEIPSDALYYGCLDGNYDGNGNGRYGEVTDGANGGDVDLTAEVMVGRFPVTNAVELAHMVRKTLRHESAGVQDLAPNAFIAERVDMGTQVYATGFMEEIRNGSSTYALDSLGFETSPYKDTFNTGFTLYDSDAYLWTTADAFAFLNRNYQTISHLGHGAVKQCMKIPLTMPAYQLALSAFTNEMPYFIYSQTCSAGAFDTPDCFAEQMVTVSNAACSAIMNAREGWEYNNVVGGYSHRFHRCFWDAAFRGTATRLGEINEQSRRMNIHLLSAYSANYWRWVYYELNLFGDPAAPFAAAINTTLPVLTHTPLINTYDTQTFHRVTCTVEPEGIYAPDALTIEWQTDRAPGAIQTQSLTQVEGNVYEGFIPPQPANTRIAYTLHARNHAGYDGRWPDSGESVFYVTPRLELDIRGSPLNYGLSTPDYGIHYLASGLVAVASASDIATIDGTTRYRNIGFFGAGSVPQQGTNQAFSFPIDTSSLLVWRWQCEHLLTLCSDGNVFPTQTFWVAENSLFSVPAAPQTASNGVQYAFAEWLLDGARAPAAPAYCPPAFGALLIDAPHTLEARYLPVGLDADGNGVPDWWEIQYFGSNGQDASSDGDGDGYTLLDEYRDRSSPLDPSVVPAPPRMTHVALAEIQSRPGPFTVQAVITDTHKVERAVVRWHRKAEAWQETAMTPTTNDLFTAQIGAVSFPGDDFEYQIIASDPAGYASQTDVFFFFLRFPLADIARFHDLAFVSLPTQTLVSQYMNLYNTGNADLIWTMSYARVESILSTNLPCWNRQSLGQPWQVTTNRFASPPYALFSHLVSNSKVTAPVRSTITMPPVLIGPNATLSFKHWISSEVYNATTRAFDGGIVEFSKDGGATFEQLKGPYTHTIYGWAASPWPEGTPCFAGTGAQGWQTVTFDLLKEYPEMNGFQGRALYFRFHYGGDNNTDYEGWYVDDVTVSPLQWQQGFANSIESTYNYTVAGGDYKRVLWCNLPPSMDVRDDNISVFIRSNDPVNPRFSFNWQIKIRDYPLLPGLNAAQTATGDGLVSLATGVYDRDGEPVELAVQWSPDNGKSWNAAALTSVVSSVSTVSPFAPEGHICGVATLANAVHVTNQLCAAWASRLVTPPITVNTQILFRVNATNGYFGCTYATERLTIDNIAPSFVPGALVLAPLSALGPYAVTTNLLTLAWPEATDIPYTNLTYRLISSMGGTNLLPQTRVTLAVSNQLNTTHAYQVVAIDPVGNISAPLTVSSLVLDAFGDFDGDGMTTANEEFAGTSAIESGSCFRANLSAAAAKPGLLTLSWSGVAGRLYTVESSPTLTPPVWQPVSGFTDLAGNGSALSVDLPVSGGARFYRILVRIQ